MTSPDDAARMADAEDAADPDFAPLLGEPFASAWAEAAEGEGVRASRRSVRARLLERVAASRGASQPMCTARGRRVEPVPLAPGVLLRTLYRADPGQPPRPGEPLRACLVSLRAGAALPADGADASHREWLVLQGTAWRGPDKLGPRDYHVDPAGVAGLPWHSDEGALLFLRESALAPASGDAPFTVRDAEAGWPEFAPGIRRRVLWQRGGQAALLYQAMPGASVPRHTHGHDEECLMVEGELYLDDMLLQAGDYQLAPAGTGHAVTRTDHGVVVYAHGDLDLQFVG